MRKQLLIGMLVGVIFVVVGIFATKDTRDHKKYCTEKVSATVVNYLENISADASDILYTPVFSFEYNGQTYTATTGGYGSNYREKFPIGSNYQIKINPNNPKMIYIQSIINDNMGYAFMVLGILIFIYGLVSLITKK